MKIILRQYILINSILKKKMNYTCKNCKKYNKKKILTKKLKSKFYYLPSLIKIEIANNINKIPIAIKIIHKTFDIPKSLSGKLLCTVVVLGLDEEVLVLDVLVCVLDELLEFDDTLALFAVFEELEVIVSSVVFETF